MKLIFYSENCSTTNESMTAEGVAGILNNMGLEYDADAGTLTGTPPQGDYYSHEWYAILSTSYGTTTERILLLFHSLWDGNAVTVTLTDDQKNRLKGFKFELDYPVPHGSNEATVYIDAEVTGEFVYPTGQINLSDLPVTPIGFKGFQEATGFTHLQIIVAEIQDNGSVGGVGHVWQSGFFSKASDYTVMLENLVPISEGKALTKFNVSYYFVHKNDEGGYDFVSAKIIGEETNVTTFSVAAEEIPQIGVDFNVAGKVYCLSPVLLTVNRKDNSEIEKVQIKLADYSTTFEFYSDRNLLQIDLSEYLKTLWAGIDVFEYQQMTPTLAVFCLDGEGNQLVSASFDLVAVFGKKPDAELPSSELRVQWVDKYGYLHDEYFKIVDSVSEGESSQKYLVSGEEREDKSGEKSITLAYVLANKSQKEALKTIVFSDHVRAYIGDSWKRVKVSNTYKTGVGREKQNFEFTIKYTL